MFSARQVRIKIYMAFVDTTLNSKFNAMYNSSPRGYSDV